MMRSKDCEPKYKVRLRGGFSDRNGIRPENVEMQYKSLDERSRISLVNVINILFDSVYKEDYYGEKEQQFLKGLLFHVYMQEVDFSRDVRYKKDKVFEVINDTIMNDEYDNVLTLVEYIAQKLNEDSYRNILPNFNAIFEKEYIGYRFVNNLIVRITDENEIEAITSASATEYKNVDLHIKKAVSLLANREHPDYENSIKKSISAVEAICEYLTGKTGKEATLGNMLKKLEESGVVMHSAMKAAFNQLYGYTSDANGIRHAGNIGGPSSTFDEAKFMLVSCSAFVNYLIGVSFTLKP